MYRKSGGGGPPPGSGGGGGGQRPPAMHVDDYQAREDEDGGHGGGSSYRGQHKNYSPSDQYDASNHSPRYRSPSYRNRGSEQEMISINNTGLIIVRVY